MDKPAGSTRRRLAFLIGGILGAVLVIGGAGYFLTRPAPDRGGEDHRAVRKDSAKKSMEEWIEEFAAPGKVPEPTAPDNYRQTWEAVNRSSSRISAIQPLKQSGKVVGSEYGLLNPVLEGIALTPGEQRLLTEENRDRRTLFAFIAEHSDPPRTYEQVANEYVRNRWREWPPK